MERQRKIKLVPKWIYINYDEREGLHYLGGIIIFIIVLFILLETAITPKPEDLSHYHSLFETVKAEEGMKAKAEKSNELFYFDPNTLGADSLQLLALPENVIRNLQSYISKGGRIRSKEDLKKIYGLTDSDYNRLAPYISIISVNKEKKSGVEKQISHIEDTISHQDTVETEEMVGKISIQPSKYREEYRRYSRKEESQQDMEQEINVSFEYTPYKTRKSNKVDLNNADEAVLQYIKGIGPVFAKRIIKYRELLGGYHHLGQLQEVYGLDIDMFLQIKDQVEISGNTRKLNFNTDNYRELVHPYISAQEAKVIVAYRHQHGDYQSIYDLLQIQIFDEYFIEKILPYTPRDLIAENN